MGRGLGMPYLATGRGGSVVGLAEGLAAGLAEATADGAADAAAVGAADAGAVGAAEGPGWALDAALEAAAAAALAESVGTSGSGCFSEPHADAVSEAATMTARPVARRAQKGQAWPATTWRRQRAQGTRSRIAARISGAPRALHARSTSARRSGVYHRDPMRGVTLCVWAALCALGCGNVVIDTDGAGASDPGTGTDPGTSDPGDPGTGKPGQPGDPGVPEVPAELEPSCYDGQPLYCSSHDKPSVHEEQASGTVEMHVVGVYEAESQHSFDCSPVGGFSVQVTRKGTHALVLSSYEPVY